MEWNIACVQGDTEKADHTTCLQQEQIQLRPFLIRHRAMASTQSLPVLKIVVGIGTFHCFRKGTYSRTRWVDHQRITMGICSIPILYCGIIGWTSIWFLCQVSANDARWCLKAFYDTNEYLSCHKIIPSGRINQTVVTKVTAFKGNNDIECITMTDFGVFRLSEGSQSH